MSGHFINVTRDEIDAASPAVPGSKLGYAAELFKRIQQVRPDAALLISGNILIAGLAKTKLGNVFGVSPNKIDAVKDLAVQPPNSANIILSFSGNIHPNYIPSFVNPNERHKVKAEFKVEWEKVEIEFEVSPDGAFVEEIQAKLQPLKLLIKKHAVAGLSQNYLKIATKIDSVVSFERKTSVRIETELKEKLKLSLSKDILFPGTKKTINVEFYGGGGIKLADGSIKPVFEGGVMLTVPFDLL